MRFFDTNVLVYYSVMQDEGKQKIAEELIEKAIVDEVFFLSPLVFSEYVFSLAKLGALPESQPLIEYFKQYVQEIPFASVALEAYDLCYEIDTCKSINDVIHLKVAERFCGELVTFDRDFRKLREYAGVEVEVLP